MRLKVLVPDALSGSVGTGVDGLTRITERPPDMINSFTTHQITSSIENHIRAKGGHYSQWYCGIAADPNDRLLSGHNANSDDNDARYWDCGNADTARSVEREFLGRGCKGGDGGGDHRTKYAYVYRPSSKTRE